MPTLTWQTLLIEPTHSQQKVVKCPECGSEDNTEKLNFPDISENRTEYLKSRYSYIFGVDNYKENSTFGHSLIIIYGILGGLVSLFGVCGLVAGEGNALLVIPLGISSITAIYYTNGGKSIIEDKEGFIVNNVEGKYYCKRDNLFFDEDGIFEPKKIDQIEDELSYFYSVRPWYKRASILSGITALLALFFNAGLIPNIVNNFNTKNTREEITYPVALKDIGYDGSEKNIKDLPNLLIPKRSSIKSICGFNFHEGNYNVGHLIDLVSSINIERYPDMGALEDVPGILYSLERDYLKEMRKKEVVFSYVAKINPRASELLKNARSKYGIKFAGLEYEDSDIQQGILKFQGVQNGYNKLSPSDSIKTPKELGTIVYRSWECVFPEEGSDGYTIR